MLGRLAETVFGLRSSLENPSTSLANPAQWLLDLASGGKSAAGVAVTEERALGVPTAYACANLLSRQMAALPLHVFRKNGKFSEPAPEHWAQALLADVPNFLQTAFAWRQQMMVHALLWGNHYSVIDVAPSGEASFVPLLPWHTRIVLVAEGRRKIYITRLLDGTEKAFREDQIIHIPALSPNGITGVSPVRTLRNMYGLAIAAEDFGGRFFSNDARPGVILETPAAMKPEAQKNLVESLYQKYTGAENRWKVLVLEEGAKMHTVQMPLEDAQFLGTRLAQDVQICGQFGVPPHMVGIVEKVSSWGSGIYEMTAGFVKYTLRPWCECIEQEFNRKLFDGTEFFAKHNLEGILRGDYKTRMEGHEIAIRAGLLLPDEGRALEDREPLPGGLGKIPFISQNLQTIENAKKAKADASSGEQGAREFKFIEDDEGRIIAAREERIIEAQGEKR